MHLCSSSSDDDCFCPANEKAVSGLMRGRALVCNGSNPITIQKIFLLEEEEEEMPSREGKKERRRTRRRKKETRKTA